MVSIIVAIARDGVIGNNNSLLWHITEDMRYFRAVTSGHAVVMGRKTYDSIGRPLPKRRNVVITRQDISIEGCEVAHSLEEALAMHSGEEEIFIIGGAEIYSLAMPLANRFYLTRVDASYSGDTHFPEWSAEEWQMISSENFERGAEFEHPFSFEVYERRGSK